MARVTFAIPLNREDLLSADSSDQYVVHQLLYPDEISKKINDARAALSESGCLFILDHFDTLFSAVHNAKDLDARPILATHSLIIRGMEQMGQSLQAMMEDCDSDFQNSLLNMTKMYMFLFSEVLRALEDKVIANANKEMAVDAKSRKKAAKNFTDFDWDDMKNSSLVKLYNFVQLPLQKLWDPPVADEDFVNLAANVCYKVLEDPQISQVRLKSLRESINHILGTLILRYNHGLSCTVKMVQLLKLYEHLAVPFSEAVVLFVHEYGCRSFVREVVRELADAEMAYDNNAPKACSQFLLELAQIGADILLPSMPLLMPHLESDSYMMRNCVLGVMGEIISSLLSEEHLNDELRETRDLFLEHLEEHLLDTNAYVRCRVLKVWQRLCQEKAIPLSRLSQLLEHVVVRLNDISWSVARNAVQLFCALLQSNPFGDKLELQKLREKLEDEERNLAVMEKEISSKIPASREKQWEDIAPQITVLIQEELASGSSEDEIDDLAETCSDNSVPENIKQISVFLDAKQYGDAFKVLRFTEKQFPSATELRCDREVGWQVDYFLKLLRKIFLGFNESNEDGKTENRGNELTNEQKEAQEQLLKQRALTQYLKNCIVFAEQLETATSIINNLLLSAQPAVIQDALDFLTAAYQFGLEGAMAGVRNMLLLVWSSETAVREAVAIAYKTLYLEIGMNAPGRSRAGEIVRNLCNLLKTLDEDQQAALEVLVKEWVKNNDMDKECIQVMWERFSMKLPDTTEEESRTALILLGMVGGAETNIIKTNINVLVTVGLGERGEKDHRMVKETCSVLLKLVPENVSVISNEEPLKFEQDNVIFQRLCSILKEGFLNLEDKYYPYMAYEAIDVIFQLSENPDVTCASLLNDLTGFIKRKSPDKNFDSLMEQGEVLENSALSCNPEKVPVEILNRFVFFIGHIAFRQWVHLDRVVFRELKRRNRIREARNEEKRGDKEKGKNKDKRKSQANLNSSFMSRASETPRHKKDKEDAADAEIGEINADDAEAEYINQVCEMEVVTGGTLLAALRPVVVAVCTNPQKYPDKQLRSTASLALTKLMLVSSSVCEEHLPLVFTMMERSTEPQIRSNLVYAVGDLANRFPNLIEPWTKHLYARLQDPSSKVRLDTIVVLKHLITNEMVKVRGQISDMALCIVDADEKIAVMANQFFHDLSKKGNTLYNVMPDIISRLSNPSMNVPENHFHTILEFLMPLIQKDRQMEGLVDKLCQRFRASTTERQWSDIAFCLSLLQYSERSIRRLTENFPCYFDKLNTPKVYEAFETIISQAMKTTKPERKALVEELQGKIDDCLKRGTSDEKPTDGAEQDGNETIRNEGAGEDVRTTVASGSRRSGGSRPNNKVGAAKKGRGRQRKVQDSSEEDNDDTDDDETPAEQPNARRGTRRKRQ